MRQIDPNRREIDGPGVWTGGHGSGTHCRSGRARTGPILFFGFYLAI